MINQLKYYVLQLGDPNPNQAFGFRNKLKGVCLSLFGTAPVDPIDLFLKGMHCWKCIFWVSERYHTPEVNTAQKGLRTG